MKSVFARFLGDRKALQIVALYIAVGLITRLLEDAFQAIGLLPTDEHSDASVVAIGAATAVSLLWSLFSTSFLYTALSQLVRPRPLAFFRRVELMIVETIRAISASLIRLPLLIVPAIFEWIRLTPIPFIVLFDSSYDRGDVDALKRARQYFRQHWLRVILLILPALAFMITELVITLSPEDALPFWQAPLQHTWSIVGFALARLVLDAFVLVMYARTFDQLTAPSESMSNR